MGNKRVTPIVLAVVGFAAVMIGIYQGLVHVAPGYEGTIMTGWGGDLNHEERLLAGIGTIGVGGAAAARQWNRLAVVPVAMGIVILFYALRAIFLQVQNVRLYTEATTYGGDPVVFILGAEPFLLIAGGLFIASAGIVERRRHITRKDGHVVGPPAIGRKR